MTPQNQTETTNATPSAVASFPRLLRWPQLEPLIQMSKTTVWIMVGKGEFPAPVKIGERAVAWREEEVRTWIESRERWSTKPENRKRGRRKLVAA